MSGRFGGGVVGCPKMDVPRGGSGERSREAVASGLPSAGTRRDGGACGDGLGVVENKACCDVAVRESVSEAGGEGGSLDDGGEVPDLEE